MPSDRGTKFLLVAASLVVVMAGLRATANIVQPLLLALFLAVLSFPLLDWLLRRHVRTGLAVLATVVAVIAFVTVLGLLISGAVNEFAGKAPAYLEQLYDKAKSTLDGLEFQGVRLSKWVFEPIDPRQFMDVAGGILGGTVKGVAAAVWAVTLVTVALIFILYELVIFPGKLRAALSSPGDSTRHFKSASREIQRYLGIKTAISIVTGIIVGAWVALLGVAFPLLWGLAAFLLNYIPVFGSIIAAVPAILVALVQHGGVRALVLAMGYLVVKVVIGDLIEPHLMGRRFGLSTLVVLLSLVFWGWLWGPLGMLLSVPLTMVIKILLENTSSLRWVAVLLGPAAGQARPPARRALDETPGDNDARVA